MLNSSDALELINIAQLYSTYSTFIAFGFGVIGSFLNIVIFTNLRIFHQNRCTFYLTIESMVDILQLTQIFVNEILKSTLNDIEPMNVSSFWCKLRAVVPQWSRFMLSVIICFVAIDQFFSTNCRIHLRRFSSLKVAKREIYIGSLFCLFHTVPFFIYQEIRSQFGCIITNIVLKNYYTVFYYPILNGVIPILISSIFSIFAYQNVRRLVQRQIPLSRRRLDQQLTAMLFVRVITYVILSLPYTVYRIYFLSTNTDSMNEYQYAMNQLISIVVSSLMYFNHGINFYIFLTTSSRYRRQVKYFLRKICWQSIKRHCHICQNTIQPIHGITVLDDS